MTLPMDALHIADLEAAINHWRAQTPAQAGAALAPAVAALAEVYARMVFERRDTVAVAALTDDARAAWLSWYGTTPDTPCIAICSTNQGDAVCKGCGRTEDEVRQWLSMTPWAKRAVWRRITLAQTAWRFTRYAERAREGRAAEAEAEAEADEVSIVRAANAAAPARGTPARPIFQIDTTSPPR